MVVSRTLVELNAALAGVMVEASFAKSAASIATFSEERTLSCPFDRWDSPLIDIIEVRGDWEKAARRYGCEKRRAK